jgi:uncharacterized protein (DUF433 family)
MLDRIISDAAILGGKPIIRGTRISVEIILEWIASGASRDDIVRKHPHLTAIDVEQALAYAAAAVRNEVLVTAEVGG